MVDYTTRSPRQYFAAGTYFTSRHTSGRRPSIQERVNSIRKGSNYSRGSRLYSRKATPFYQFIPNKGWFWLLWTISFNQFHIVHGVWSDEIWDCCVENDVWGSGLPRVEFLESKRVLRSTNKLIVGLILKKQTVSSGITHFGNNSGYRCELATKLSSR